MQSHCNDNKRNNFNIGKRIFGRSLADVIFCSGEAWQDGGSKRCLALSFAGLESCGVDTLHADLPHDTAELVKYPIHSGQSLLLSTLSTRVAVDINSWLLYTDRQSLLLHNFCSVLHNLLPTKT